MAKAQYQPNWNFLGMPDELATRERAAAWVLPIPYEGTTSYGSNTREGPAAIIAASRQVELFDREFGCEACDEYGIHTLPPLAPDHRSPEAMAEAVSDAVRAIRSAKRRPKLLAILGGEHSITPGAVRALVKGDEDEAGLVAVQIDAHADLRAEYEGSAFSHACAARRILDHCPVFQIGIRNLSAGEEKFRVSSKRVETWFAEDIVGLQGASDSFADCLKALARFVRRKRVYLTIDLDGLDPSIMPSVGTPEPGGISWEMTLHIVRTIVAEAERVPAFDIVELAPIPGLRAPDFLAAKLAYKLMSLILLKGN